MIADTEQVGKKPFDGDPRKVADFIVEICLAFGSSVYTAYKVAGLFVEGLGWEPPPRFLTHTVWRRSRV